MRCTQKIGFDLESGFIEGSRAFVPCSAISWDYLLNIAACIFNAQSPGSYTQQKYISCSMEFQM